jgi:hypothetical protein
MYVSGEAIARRTRDLLKQRRSRRSQVLQFTGGHLKMVTSEIVAQAVSQGFSFHLKFLMKPRFISRFG